MQKFPRCPVSDRTSKTTTIRSWLFHWPVFMISPVHYISFKFTGPEDYNQSNFTKLDVAWFFPRESKTAEFYSKDIDGAVENTLISLQGLSFSKFYHWFSFISERRIFWRPRGAPYSYARIISQHTLRPGVISYALHSAYRWITQMKIFSVRDRNVLYFVLIGLFQSEKSSQFFKLICSKLIKEVSLCICKQVK